jgi:enoyl-CoA hydratase
MVNELYATAELMNAVLRIAENIASNSPTAVRAVKQAVLMGASEPTEQAVAIMMESHWRSVVHPDRIEGGRAFTVGREPTFPDPDCSRVLAAMIQNLESLRNFSLRRLPQAGHSSRQ